MFSVMGAISPEELETALEDAFVLRDTGTLSGLFVEGAVVTVGEQSARGVDEVTRLVASMWDEGQCHVAGTARVLQAGDLALVAEPGGMAVMRRGQDRQWRYAIWSKEEK
jgi:hypothetical protein